MPKKTTTTTSAKPTQLSAAVEMIQSYKLPLTKASRAEVMEKIVTKFNCSKQTAYYYYFYKAMKLLQKDGITVAIAERAVKKKVTKATTTKDLIAKLPADTQKAMKKASPFAQLGV